ncbi:nickel permease LarQ [Alistipes sp.]|jgi:cobalt/nickel transport system permease protein|nr:nickel permease LarQ [Alistipes sp.]
MKNRMQRALADMICRERALDGSGIMARFDDRAKLLATLVYLVAMLSAPIYRPSQLILFAIFPITMSAASDTDYLRIARRSLIVVPLAAVIGIFNVLYDRRPAMEIGTTVITMGWIGFVSIVLRAMLSVQALSILILNTGFRNICRAMQRLGMPPVLATQLLLLYRYAYVLIDEVLTMSRARDARSFGRRAYPIRIWGVMIGQLLARSACRSRAVYAAMLARGFDGSIPQCDARPCRWRLRDTALVAAWTIISAAIRLADPAGIIQTFRL